MVEFEKGLGYRNTGYTGAEHHAWTSMLGRVGCAATVAAGRVSAAVGEGNTVRIEPGVVFGHAIRDVVPEQKIGLPVPAAGTLYYLITRRAVWGETDRSHIEVIQGTPDRQIPAYKTTAGTEADLPLALVAIRKGAAGPTEIVDLRLIATETGTYTIFDDLALQVAAPRPGIQCYNANTGTLWMRTYNSGGSLIWVPTYPTRLSGVRPHLQIGREVAFNTPVVSTDAPVYAAVAAATRKVGDADAHMRAHLGADKLANPHSSTDPARIEILTAGVYAVELRAQVLLAADDQFYLGLDAVSGGGYLPVSRQYAPGGKRTEVTLAATRYYGAGRTIGGEWGTTAGSAFTPQRFFISATRISD